MDRVLVYDGVVDVLDYKTNKDVKKPAYVNWEGITSKMNPPLLHLDDCKLVEYAIQLSLGMYVILRHNPQLKAGKLIINYISFETLGEDQYGYPIMAKTDAGDYIVKGVEDIEVPYLKREVELILNFLNPK